MLVQVIHTTDSPVGNAVSAAVSVAAATGIGLYMGTRRQYVEALRERALQLARERALEADSALAEERARIARELHDVVAHHVTLMVVQAGALRETLPADDPGRPMLDSMADTGRQALGEMRRVLDLLRVTDGGERGPQPSVEQIDEPGHPDADGRPPGRADRRRRAASRADCRRRVCLQDRAGGADQRPQARRHGREPTCSCATCLTRSSCGSATTARAPRQPAPPGGHGLIGMRERTALFGGSLRAGAAPGRRLPAAGGAADGRGRGVSGIRVVVADDQPLMRAGFRMILEAQPDIQVVGEAGDGAEAVERHRARPAGRGRSWTSGCP